MVGFREPEDEYSCTRDINSTYTRQCADGGICVAQISGDIFTQHCTYEKMFTNQIINNSHCNRLKKALCCSEDYCNSRVNYEKFIQAGQTSANVSSTDVGMHSTSSTSIPTTSISIPTSTTSTISTESFTGEFCLWLMECLIVTIFIIAPFC